jgi:type IV pilus assembly protein PilM
MAALGTGISIGSRTIRVLQVKKQKDGTWQVLKALSAPYDGEEAPDSRRVAEGRSALQSAGAKGSALVGLSGRDLIMRYTQVPPVPDWRLEMLMNFEIQEVAEQSGGDVSAAYSKLEIDDTTTGDEIVLVALAKNGHLKPRLDALKGAGLDALGGCPRAVAAYWAYKENGHLRHDETVVIMNIGNENTDLAIAREGELVFARNISGGSKNFTDSLVTNMRVNRATAEKLKITKGNLTPRGQAKYRDSGEEKVANNLMGVGGHFVSAFNSSIMFAKAQSKVPDCDPDRCVIMGAGAKLRGFAEYLESNLGVPVELFDPVDELDLSPLSSDAQAALKQEQGGIATTLGLAQMAADSDSFQLEVLPEADRKKRQFMQETLPVIISGIILLIGVVVAFVFAGQASEAAESEKGVLEQKSKDFEANRSAYNKARQSVELINDEKFRLRRLVALGPATEHIVGIVQRVIDLGFEEIYISKMKASLKEIVVDEQREFIPEVEFEATVESTGERPPQTAYGEFGVAAQAEVKRVGGMEYDEIGGLETEGAGTGVFKFRIRQLKFPERVEAERAAESADGNGG